ncbi:hypothetical protein [Paenibacillus humicola]|uniref:hypothetical protein n=1 Tax=Paenibacillus humicola TaxID=3110540 RepID=UPI00237A3751|nr:hypothetical protein [Paenibacillus humicola]
MTRITRMENLNRGSSGRKGRVPFVIANHFKAHGGKGPPAAHFKILKSGAILQFIDIERAAYPEPLFARTSAHVIEENREVHPALYSVSIQYEETGGDWNDEQLAASLWLHEHIRNAIAVKYGRWFPLSRYHVITLDDPAHEKRHPFYESLVRIDDEHALDDLLAALESLNRQGMFM